MVDPAGHRGRLSDAEDGGAVSPPSGDRGPLDAATAAFDRGDWLTSTRLARRVANESSDGAVAAAAREIAARVGPDRVVLAIFAGCLALIVAATLIYRGYDGH